MAQASIALLGPPEVRWEGRLVAFRTRKALALLAYLAVEGQAHPRDQLAALFWPGGEPAQRRAMLRTTLQHLRRALPEPLVRAEGDTLAFVRGAELLLDIEQLGAAASLIRATLPPDRPALRPALEAAAALCRGEFMQDFNVADVPAFDHWLLAQRQRWRQHAELTHDQLLGLLAESGESGRALDLARRWAAADPLHEPATEWLMRLLFAAGDLAAALHVYESHAALVRRELSAGPAPELAALAERIRREGQATMRAGAGPADAAGPAAQAPPMVGRAAELAQLIGLLHRFRAGQPQAALISGEAGIGKTRLARELVGQALADGLDVWEARAFEAVGRLSYQVVIDAVRARIERENAPVDLLSDVWLAELSRLLPELRERYPDLPQPLAVGEAEAQLRLFEAVARLAGAMAARAAVVVFIDDIQWADPASLDLLHYLARQAQAQHMPLLLLATVRAENLADPAIASWGAALGRELPVASVPLHTLAPAHTQQWVQALATWPGAAPPAELLPAIRSFSAWLHEETGGQPFFMIETLRTLRERDLIDAPAQHEAALDVRAAARLAGDPAALRAALGIPTGVHDIIRARTQRLGDQAAELLAAAAVIGMATGFESLRAVAALGEREALRALDELLEARLIQEHSAGHGYVITHDKIRAVAYAAAGSARRRAYHGRALAALAPGAPASELARHALAAGQPAESAHWSLAAGDRALQLFDVRRAIEHYEQAAAQLGGDLAQAGLPALLRVGRAYELGGRLDQAQQIYAQLLASARASHAEALEVAALSRLATLAIQSFDEARMSELMAQMLAVASSTGDRRLEAEVAWTLAQSNNYLARLGLALEQGERALALAAQLGDDELTARCLNALAYIYSGTYRGEGALQAAEQSAQLYARLGNPAMESDSLAQVASAQMRLGRPRAAIEAALRSRARAEAVENPWGIANGDAQLAIALAEAGELGPAWQAAERALQRARAQQVGFLIPVAQITAGAVARMLLRLDTARSLLADARELALPQSLGVRASTELCAACALQGDWPAAGALALQLPAAAHPMFLSGRAIWLEAEALLRMGQRERAAAHVAGFGAAIGGSPRAAIDHARAQAALLLGEQPAQAAEQLALAADAAAALGLRLDRWQILRALAQAHTRAGAAEAARAAEALAEQGLRELAGSIADAQARAAFLAQANKAADASAED